MARSHSLQLKVELFRLASILSIAFCIIRFSVTKYHDAHFCSGLHVSVCQGSGATIQGNAVEAGKAIELKSDAEEKPTVVQLAQESVTFVVIKRDTKLGVRVKDKKN